MPFTKETLRKILAEAKEVIESKFDYLNELDSATGDGDHGTAILSAMKGAVEAARQDAPLAQMFQNIGWGIMNATGGSTSLLLGSFFLGMGDAFDKEELNGLGISKVLDSGLKQVQMMTTAKVGDKTLMDAMIPAVEAARLTAEKDPEATTADVLAAAAAAAAGGASSTDQLVARFGRAKNLGERSVGHRDAGAVSMSYIFQAFADGSRQ